MSVALNPRTTNRYLISATRQKYRVSAGFGFYALKLRVSFDTFISFSRQCRLRTRGMSMHAESLFGSSSSYCARQSCFCLRHTCSNFSNAVFPSHITSGLSLHISSTTRKLSCPPQAMQFSEHGSLLGDARSFRPPTIVCIPKYRDCSSTQSYGPLRQPQSICIHVKPWKEFHWIFRHPQPVARNGKFCPTDETNAMIKTRCLQAAWQVSNWLGTCIISLNFWLESSEL